MNLYGWSKQLFDLAVVERVRRGDKLPPQWAGLKFFNVFGLNEYHKGEMMSLVAKRFDEAKAGKPIRLFKSHRAGIADGELLAEARAACDRLLVGLNSDASTARLKGKGRPINPAEGRAEVLAALEAVDLVVVFDEDTPLELIKRVRPAVLVKGADYTRNEVVGREVVKNAGGDVILVDLVPGHSTTAMVERARPVKQPVED